MRKFYFVVFLFLLSVNPARAQVTGLSWLRTIGGAGLDYLTSNVILRNGNFISVGYTESNDGISAGNHGMSDCIVTCTTPDGIIIWKKLIGGSFQDGFLSVNVDTTTDGNIVVGITSGSPDGDFSGAPGDWDISFVKLTPAGVKLWSKTYGGINREILGQLRATPDGGFIASASTTSSATGNVTGTNHGAAGTRDVWILKLDVNGIIQWQKIYGGSLNESAGIGESGGTIAVCSDGGYLFSINTESSDGDLAGLLPPGTITGPDDIWLLKIDATGNILWQKKIGGSKSDNGSRLYVTPGGNFYLLFYTESFDRDLAGNIGSEIAIFKYTAAGTLIWKKQHGSFSVCTASGFTGVNGDLLTVVGSCYSTTFGGIPLYNYGQSTMLVYRIDTLNGNIKWLKDLGGGQVDNAADVKITPDNELFIVGGSTSNDFDIPGNHGYYDGVAFKLDAANNIKGLTFLDLNNDNIFNTGDIKPDYVRMQAKKNNLVVSESLTAKGVFNIEVDTGTYYTKTALWNSGYYTSIPDSFACNFATVNQTCTNNIALHPVNGIKDLRVNVFPVGIARSAFATQYILIGYNVGTQTIPTGTITLKKDPRINYTYFSVPPNNISGDSVTWNFTNLNPFDSIRYVIRIFTPPPPIVKNFDTLRFTASILPVAGDAYATDNTLNMLHLTVASHDPNLKANLHGNAFAKSAVQNGGYINYVIQFQNTGTAEAFDVIVKDSLTNMLQDGTLEIIAASHPFTFILKNKIATWKFSNINLPDSNTNEPASHGYIAFRIKPVSTLNTGDEIINRAAIYFDFNPAVITENDTLRIVNISLPPNPPVITPGGDTAFCSGSIVLRSNVSTGNQWYKNGVAITGATADSLIVTGIGSYSAKVTQGVLASAFSNVTNVITGALAVVPVIQANGYLLSVTNPAAGTTYSWQVKTGASWANTVPPVTGLSYTAPSTGGEYRVMATQGICTANSTSKIILPRPVPVTGNIYGIYIYPIPAVNTLYIDNLELRRHWDKAEVVSMLGQVVIPMIDIRNRTSVNIDISNLSSGMYYLRLKSAFDTYADFKIVKVK
ncbi:MAG: T9SS type A sorting domain-containing protein [Ferruginibacter sp.]